MQRLCFQPGESLTDSSWLEGSGRDSGSTIATAHPRKHTQQQEQQALDAREVERLKKGAEIIDCRGGSALGCF